MPKSKGGGTKTKVALKPTLKVAASKPKKTVKAKKSITTALKALRLPARGQKELDARTRLVADILKKSLSATGTTIDLDRVRLIKAHDTGSRLPRLISMKATELTGKKAIDTVDRVYRVTWDAMDEFVRTSFVRNMIIAIAPGDLPAVQQKLFEDVVRSLSAFRMPTQMSGFNFNDGTRIAGFTTMQHPTSPGTGMWLSNTTGHGGAHNHLDQARITEIQDRVMEFFDHDAKTNTHTLKPGVTLQRVVDTMVRVGGTFTFRNFTMPAMASNVTTEASFSDADREMQTRIREYLKDQLEIYGATRSTAVRPSPPVVPTATASPPSTAVVTPVKVPKLDLDLLQRPVAPELLNPGEISPRRTSTPVKFEDIQGAFGL
jgi:hypothetical protein